MKKICEYPYACWRNFNKTTYGCINHLCVSVVMLFVLGLSVGAPDAGAFVGGEYWDEEAASKGVEPSGSLPVLYINTENGAVIDQKVTYIPGEYWLDAKGIAGYNDIGSADEMLPLEIRGRGNTTFFGFDKKPYKIKLGKKQSMLGMGKNKHWGLLHFIGDNTSYFAEYIFRMLSRKLMKCWTPDVKPVECVLNGQYIGLYFLCETIRIDETRLDINEQPEGNEDPDLMDDGWLIEIDNHPSDNYISMEVVPGGRVINITPDTPDPMTDAQRRWLIDEIDTLNSAIYTPDKLSRDIERLLDFDALARH